MSAKVLRLIGVICFGSSGVLAIVVLGLRNAGQAIPFPKNLPVWLLLLGGALLGIARWHDQNRPR